MEVGLCERKLIGRRREEKGDNEDDTAPAVARGAAHMSSAARAARRICIFLETGQVFEWVYRCISLLLVITLLHSRREPTISGNNEPQLKGNFRISNLPLWPRSLFTVGAEMAPLPHPPPCPYMHTGASVLGTQPGTPCLTPRD